jgi:hypothetical protein
VPQGAGQADRIVLVVKDKDGNDTGPGAGGDEYHSDLLLNQFNTSTMTTVSLPLSTFTAFTAGEFVNAGDGLLTNFNLYQFDIETIVGAGLVNMEIESIRVMLPAPPGLPGDFNGDMQVDAADYTVWRNSLASGTPLLNETASLGTVDHDDYAAWKANFGTAKLQGGGSVISVPEPATIAIWLGLLTPFILVSRRSAFLIGRQVP